jgi:hypothetical protein
VGQFIFAPLILFADLTFEVIFQTNSLTNPYRNLVIIIIVIIIVTTARS